MPFRLFLVEERFHVAVLKGFDHGGWERAAFGSLLLQLGQRLLRALDHGAGQLVRVDGVVARRQDELLRDERNPPTAHP